MKWNMEPHEYGASCKKKKRKHGFVKHWYHEWNDKYWNDNEQELSISYTTVIIERLNTVSLYRDTELCMHELFVIKSLYCIPFNHGDQMTWNDSVYLSYIFLNPQDNQV